MTDASAFGPDSESLFDISDECCDHMTMAMERAAVRVVLADHTKFGRRSFCRCLPWEKINILITVFHPDNHEILREIRARGVKVIFAGAGNGDGAARR